MPGQDRTGPEGQGPMTGRKMGLCNNDKDDPSTENTFGRGFGRGCRRGFCRGFGNRNVSRNQTKEETVKE